MIDLELLRAINDELIVTEVLRTNGANESRLKQLSETVESKTKLNYRSRVKVNDKIKTG